MQYIFIDIGCAQNKRQFALHSSVLSEMLYIVYLRCHCMVFLVVEDSHDLGGK